MSYKQLMLVISQNIRLPVKDNPCFGREVIKYPYIMIACKKMNRYAPVCYLGYFAEEPCKSTGYNLFILEPVIKDVTYKE